MATEPDFDLQMQSLAVEAQHIIDEAQVPRRREPALTDFLRPLAQHIENLSRSVKDNTMAIMRIEETVLAQSHISNLPRLITALHDDLENRNGVNQKLFDAMHEELKGYKDGFLLEVLHRPIIRDLILLYDDLSDMHKRTSATVDTMHPGKKDAELQAAQGHCAQLATNLNNVTHSLLEILARMDVQKAEPLTGKLDKMNQRVVDTLPASGPEDDLTVVSSLKPGFRWRGRTIRAEEVIVRKWKPETGAPIVQNGTSSSH
jgi:molecular chaperone GrpE (heat shock protein)